MDRREFLKVTGAGALTLFLSGCGINAVSGDKKAGAAPAAGNAEAKPGSVSNGKPLKIVVLCGSPHKAGTSALLADKFIEGAKSAGHEVFRFNAAFEDINPCRGCDACGMNGPCVIRDAISEKLIQKLVDCDMVALVTPLYYYGFSAQIKMVIDRFYSRTGSIHRKKSALLAIDRYVNFLVSFVIPFGLLFEMPLIAAALARTGLIHAETLRQGRRLAVLISFIVSALLTPPDVMSQVMMAIPSILLF